MNVPVDGAELHVTMHGRGPACFVLSAIGTEPYERQMPAALRDRLQLVHVDPRGAGRSTGSFAELTFDLLADDLEAVRAALGLERTAVLGHSIAGVLAIEYARRHPESVSHAVAVGTPPSADMARLSALALAFFEEEAAEERKRLLLENLAALPPAPSPRQTLLAQTPMRFFDPRFDAAPLFEGAVNDPAVFQHLFGKLARGWEVTADAGSLAVPLFVAVGRHDYVVPHVLWDGIAPQLPDATVEIFEESGHQPFFEEPERFATAIANWMGRS
jgi:proline iminopeptidase